MLLKRTLQALALLIVILLLLPVLGIAPEGEEQHDFTQSQVNIIAIKYIKEADLKLKKNIGVLFLPSIRKSPLVGAEDIPLISNSVSECDGVCKDLQQQGYVDTFLDHQQNLNETKHSISEYYAREIQDLEPRSDRLQKLLEQKYKHKDIKDYNYISCRTFTLKNNVYTAQLCYIDGNFLSLNFYKYVETSFNFYITYWSALLRGETIYCCEYIGSLYYSFEGGTTWYQLLRWQKQNN
ncbi:hypothetical protein SAMN04515695_0161 [Pseudovibrio sp. Tun.PSC04-5.I4]|nr:hypothetical protein SAMN04515695_0161 [Pseudovibrio sp. Tun.PSC04-5.I4]